ncbi:unnamed protein product [Arctogadus glacialis]
MRVWLAALWGGALAPGASAPGRGQGVAGAWPGRGRPHPADLGSSGSGSTYSHGTGSPIGPPVASLSPALLAPVSSSWSARGRHCTVRSLRRRDRILRPDNVYPGATSPE